MRRTARRILPCAFLLMAACGSGTPAPPAASPPAPRLGAPADRATLRAVALPDLSKATTSVQKQLREAYAKFTGVRDRAASTDVELGFAYGEVGELLMAAEYRDAAEPAFLNAEALTPDEARWPYYLGHLYKLKGDSERASRAWERSLKLQPEDVANLVYLGGEYLDQGRPTDAEPLFARAFAINPRSPAVLFGVGRAALAKQEYTRAIDHLEQALALDPRAAVIHYPLALAYRGIGDTQTAEAHLRARGPGELNPPDPKMREIDTLLESAVSYEVRGAAALDDGNWDAAAEDFRRGVALAPDEPSLRHKLGTALAMKGDLQGAATEFEEVTRRWPKFAKAHYSLGLLLASSGHGREAIGQFSAAVNADPAYSEARLQLAEGLRRAGRLQESLPQYRQTMTLNPTLADARLGYGLALAGLRRVDDARTELAEGARIFPDRREFADALASLSEGPGRR